MSQSKRKQDSELGAGRSIKSARRAAKDTAPPRAAADAQAAFPRGGAGILTPLENRQIRAQVGHDIRAERSPPGAENEFNDESSDRAVEGKLFSTLEMPLKKLQRREKSTTTGPLHNEASRIEGVSFKNLVDGAKVLGQVCQINQHDIALSLPGNLTGYVPLHLVSHGVRSSIAASADSQAIKRDAPDAENSQGHLNLQDLFQVGQYLRASVASAQSTPQLAAKRKKHIQLSLLPEDVNAGLSPSNLTYGTTLQGEISSVEDHGLTIRLGLEDPNYVAFLPFTELESQKSRPTMQPGAVLLCMIVESSTHKRVIQVTSDPKRIGSSSGNHYLGHTPDVRTLLPGTAIEFCILSVTQSALTGCLMEFVNITADLFQAGRSGSDRHLHKVHHKGDSVKARIVCTIPSSANKLLVSLMDHVVSLSLPKPLDAPAHTVEDILSFKSKVLQNAKVESIEPDFGLFMSLGEHLSRGFAHISRLSDDRVESLATTDNIYGVGTLHKVRILGFNFMDGLFNLSLERRVLEQAFLHIEDVKEGDFVEGQVEKVVLDSKGVQRVEIMIGKNIRGYVLHFHLANVPPKHAETRFKKGKQVRGRVISISSNRWRLQITLKKALFSESTAVFRSYDQIQIGAKTAATIVGMVDAGAVVQFLGGICGFLPLLSMGDEHVHDSERQLFVGQVIDVCVASVDPSRKRVTVSSVEMSKYVALRKDALNELQPGSVVSASVSKTSEKCLFLTLTDSGLRGRMAIHQLSDESDVNVQSLSAQVKLGQVFHNVMVLKCDVSIGLIHLTHKPSLIQAFQSGSIPQSFSDVNAGDQVVGFVKNLTSIGILVEFAEGLTGFLPKTQISEKMSPIALGEFSTGQSIAATVLAVDVSRRRFVLTQRSLFHRKRRKTENFAPSDPASDQRYLHEVGIGMLTTARIVSVKRTQLNVELAGGAPGRVDVSSVFDSVMDVADTRDPLKAFQPNQIILVRVLGIHDARNHRFLPISHRSHATVLELSAKPSDQEKQELRIPSLDDIALNSSWFCFVNNVEENWIWVNLSPTIRGRIRILDALDDVSYLESLSSRFPPGAVLRAWVVHVDVQQSKLDLSSRIEASSPLKLDDLVTGAVLPARVTKVSPTQVFVQLSDTVSGPIQKTDLEDDFSKADTRRFHKNQIIRICVLGVDIDHSRLALSSRPSRVLSSSLPVTDSEIASFDDVHLHDIKRAFVKSVGASGIFVVLGTNVVAFVPVSDLSDQYLKDWKAHFEPGQLVQGRVINLDTVSRQVKLTLKKSLVDDAFEAPLTYSDYHVGQIARGKIRKVENFGVFVVLSNSLNVSGLCHRSEMSEEGVDDARHLYNEGDSVSVKILRVDIAGRRMTLGLKASYFEDQAKEESDLTPSNQLPNPVESAIQPCEQNGLIENDSTNSVSEGLGLDPEVLDVDAFDWTGGQSSAVLETSELGQQEEISREKTKKRRKAALDTDLTACLDSDGPQSAADFERLLLSQPESSLLWLGYIAFSLYGNDVEKAREVAYRALRAIDHQSTGYRQGTLDVWIALLNLENRFGDESTIEAVFKRACECNDRQDVHERLVSIYIRSGKKKQADALFQIMIRKFSSESKIWLNYATFLFETAALPQEARSLLPRALQALPHRNHVEATSKFALLEFRSANGDVERGRTIFESLLASFPQRHDLFNVFLDQEIIAGSMDHVRDLFVRVTKAPVKPKTAKYFFKKWLEYEEKHGDKLRIENVKARATEFIRTCNS